MERKFLLGFLILFFSAHVFASTRFYGSNGEYQGQALNNQIPIIRQHSIAQSLGQSLGEGLAKGVSQGLSSTIQNNKQISKVKIALEEMLGGYSKEKHTDYMKIIMFSEFPSSMKMGLVNAYNNYRKKRDALDLLFWDTYQKLIKKITQENAITSISQLESLTLLMDPTINQKALKYAINNMEVCKNSKKEINKFVKEYYRSRLFLYTELEKIRETLIMAYFC